ncbi:pyridoxamine 5'-phosphate oxidase family protein [uncultured Pseudoteredinibacter sp.]|uniref:pyridoxamine 5'-phosphate oxidase family protein n=1 Tax=uncultured Pseudoteredinibacter sp. TaxID=1641701 RepID=UPI00262C7133|nr:pyridoxamine 5'-phosphate oxidase family protein [uncultured Pseudoteredinibacter sp.]
MFIQTEEELREIYGFPAGRAKDKQLAGLEKHAINFIAHSPFMLLSTNNAVGELDCSPRGGSPGFVYVKDENCILIPDAKGNNRIDSLVNIVETQRAGCLFLIPGVDETLRVNGRANISADQSYLSYFEDQAKPAISCIVLQVEEVFLHCAKALMRSRLWDAVSQIKRDEFPTMAQMMKDQLRLEGEPETQRDMIQRYMKDI